MTNADDDNEQESGADLGPLFTQLVLSFQAAAWQQMGKVPSMITGKLERNLDMAKHSIDMLGMLEEKTKGNLGENEGKYLKHALFELRMNFLEEARKGPDKKEESSAAATDEDVKKPQAESGADDKT
jgi:hypothetical protein